MTANPGPPTRTPRTSTTLRPGAPSAEASLKGEVIGTTRSTPPMGSIRSAFSAWDACGARMLLETGDSWT